MSHCTKFKFTFSDERTIVKAFSKLKMPYSTDIVCQGNKALISMGLSMGNKQWRTIRGKEDEYEIWLLKERENEYSLEVETDEALTPERKRKVSQLAEKFRRAYIEVVVDDVVRKLDKGNMPSEVHKERDKYLILFGPSLEYSLSIIYEDNQIIEEVSGINGDFCTKLTEDVEDLLSNPETELITEWKQEYEFPLDDQNIQVLSLSF